MRSAIALALLTAASTIAAADTFGGFSGVDRYYLVNADKVCAPLTVEGGAAKGAPACEKQTADVIAKLSVKEPLSQKGVKGSFDAKASGRTLTVTDKSGATIVTWTAPDPIGRIVPMASSRCMSWRSWRPSRRHRNTGARSKSLRRSSGRRRCPIHSLMADWPSSFWRKVHA